METAAACLFPSCPGVAHWHSSTMRIDQSVTSVAGSNRNLPHATRLSLLALRLPGHRVRHRTPGDVQGSALLQPLGPPRLVGLEPAVRWPATYPAPSAARGRLNFLVAGSSRRRNGRGAVGHRRSVGSHDSCPPATDMVSRVPLDLTRADRAGPDALIPNRPARRTERDGSAARRRRGGQDSRHVRPLMMSRTVHFETPNSVASSPSLRPAACPARIARALPQSSRPKTWRRLHWRLSVSEQTRSLGRLPRRPR
jgi:hypothetical protein